MQVRLVTIWNLYFLFFGSYHQDPIPYSYVFPGDQLTSQDSEYNLSLDKIKKKDSKLDFDLEYDYSEQDSISNVWSRGDNSVDRQSGESFRSARKNCRTVRRKGCGTENSISRIFQALDVSNFHTIRSKPLSRISPHFTGICSASH